MASISPLNEFKSLLYEVTTTPTIVYTTPIAVATIVLKIQVANVSDEEDDISRVTVSLVKGASKARILYKGPVLANDFSIVSDGKFVLEEGDSLEVSSDKDGTLEMVISFLETSA